MKKISDMTVWERLTLIQMIKPLKTNFANMQSGLKILNKLELSEDESKKVKQDGNMLILDELMDNKKEIVLEDSDYHFLVSIFDQMDKDEEYSIDSNVLKMCLKIKKAEEI